MSPLQHSQTQHTPSLQLHPHTHHVVTPVFVDRPRRSDYTAGQMDGEAGWWTASGKIGLPPLAMVMGEGIQQHPMTRDHSGNPSFIKAILTVVFSGDWGCW